MALYVGFSQHGVGTPLDPHYVPAVKLPSASNCTSYDLGMSIWERDQSKMYASILDKDI